MDNMHLEVVSLSVNSMLRSGMEMELSGVELVGGSEEGPCEVGGEEVRTGGQVNLASLSLEGIGGVNLILVNFCERVISSGVSGVGGGVGAEVDGGLVGLGTVGETGGPVSSILRVIIDSSVSFNLGESEKGSKGGKVGKSHGYSVTLDLQI